VDNCGFTEPPPPKPKTIIAFDKSFAPIVVKYLRKTKSLPNLDFNRKCPFGKDLAYLLNGIQVKKPRKREPDRGSEDSWDRDFTIYKELRDIEAEA
jgi:hypothetical protein